MTSSDKKKEDQPDEYDEFEAEFETEGMGEPEPEDFEDAEWAEEDFESESDEDSGEKLLAKKKKKPFLNFNTLVIGGGILLGLGLFSMQVLKSSAPKTAVKDMPARGVQIDSQRDNIIFRGTRNKDKAEDASAQTPPKGGLLSGSEGVDQLPDAQPRRPRPEIVDNPPPSPAPFTGSDQAPPDEAGDQQGSAQQQQPAADPLTPMPSAADIGMAEGAKQQEKPFETPALEQPGQPLPEPTGSASSPDASAPADKKAPAAVGKSAAVGMIEKEPLPGLAAEPGTLQDADLAARLDRLEKAVGEAARKADQALANSRGGNGGADAGEIADLKKTIASLQDKVARTAVAATPRPAPRKTESGEALALTGEPASSARESKRTATSEPGAAKRSASQWELRSAQPGKAWIAKPGSNEMQTVEVGDKVEGLGRIRSISTVDGRWVVSGTAGDVAQ